MSADTPSPDTPDDPLSRWSSTFEAARERMHALAGGLDREAFNFQPAPGRWSVGQCLDHVNVAMGIYLDPMERAAEGADRRGDAPFARGPLMGRLLVAALRRPGLRLKAPKSFRPERTELDPVAVGAECDRQVGRMQALLERCDGLALGEIRMGWPVFRLIRLSLAQALELQALHTERHLDQAERVTRADAFPA